MYIHKVRIKNYKSFLDSNDIYIDKKLFAFIGQNNTGKSTILDAIQCVFPCSKKNISITDFHKETSADVEIQLVFKGVSDKYLEEIFFKEKITLELTKLKANKDPNLETKIDGLRAKELAKLKDKYKIQNENFIIKLVAKKGKNISKKLFLSDSTELSESDLKKILPQLKIIPAIRDPKNESTAGANSYLKDLIKMLDDEIQTNITVNSKSISYKELNQVISKETKKRCTSLSNEITKFYNEALGISEYEIIIDSDVNLSKGTSYTTKIKDNFTNIENDILNCGTGYQSMIILSILETYVKLSNGLSKYILLIEEPEVYLHPKLQRKMIDTLIAISNTSQIIFTSHSPITVSKLSNKQIKLIQKLNGIANVIDIEPKIVINELGIKADDILANKGIIFVEGTDDKKVFDLLLEKIQIGLSNKINVIDTGNCDNLKFYANAELLINNNFTIPTLIVRDADAKDPGTRKTELINQIIKNRNSLDEILKEKIIDSVRILESYSLEAFFIDKKLLEHIDIDIEKAILCYECQYNYYIEELLKGNVQKNLITSWYQPKYFLEKFDDKFKSSQITQIKLHNDKYINQWQSFHKCNSCKISCIQSYLTIRDNVTKYTKNLKLNDKDFMTEVILNKDLKELKETKLKNIIIMLEEFITKNLSA